MNFENKYDRIIEKDINGEKTKYKIYSSANIKECEKDKYIIIKIINKENSNIIYEYKQLNSSQPLNEFIKINNNIWWIGGKDYMTKIFLNCDTGEIFEDKKNDFIWTGPYKISPNEKYLLMDGCVWSFPYEIKLYDISDLKNGYKEIDIENHLEIDYSKRIMYDSGEIKFIDGKPYYCVVDSENLIHEFNQENNIDIFTREDQRFYNTVKLS